MPYKVIALPPNELGGGGPSSPSRIEGIGRSTKSLNTVDMATIYAETPSDLTDRSDAPNRIAASNRFSTPSPVQTTLRDRTHTENVRNSIQNRTASEAMAGGGRIAAVAKVHGRSNLHVEGADWWQKKGALFVFAGGQVSADEKPALTLYFQRFPTEYAYTLEQKVADQAIPGQTGTNFQKLGSASAKFQVRLKFHDAWLAKEQVSTAQGLKSLNSIVSEGWRYKVMWTIGGGAPVPIIIKGIKVTMSNFIHAGHTEFVGGSAAGTRHVHTIARPGYLVKNNIDDPQVADVEMEFCLDLSKDVVVPYVKRTPPKRRTQRTPPPPPSTGGGGASGGSPNPANFEAPGGMPQVNSHLNADMLGSLHFAYTRGDTARLEDLASQSRMSDQQRREYGLSPLGDRSPAIVQPLQSDGHLQLINFPDPAPLTITGLKPVRPRENSPAPIPRVQFADPSRRGNR